MCRPCANKLYTCNKIKAEFIEADEKLQGIMGFVKSTDNRISEDPNDDNDDMYGKEAFTCYPAVDKINELVCSYEDGYNIEHCSEIHEVSLKNECDTHTELEESVSMQNNQEISGHVKENCYNNKKSSEVLKLQRNRVKLKYSCVECKEMFSSKRNLSAHKRVHVKPKDLSELACEYCSRQFLQKHKLLVHLRSHTNEKPFICEHCGQGFRIKESLKNHRLKHKPPSFCCLVCGKKFHCQSNLTMHKRTHIADTRLICDLCGKILSSKLILESHLRSHQGEKPYQCTVCGKCYSSANALRCHKYSHSAKTFACKICGKGFKRKRVLTEHMNCHTKQKMYKCPVCLKAFANNGNKLRHLKVTCKNILCVVCNQTFQTTDMVEEHRAKEHSAEEIANAAKEYRMEQVLHCEICLVSMTGTSGMLKHMKTAHRTSELFMCEQCNRCFLNEEQLLRHGNPCTLKKVVSDYLKGPRGQCKICSEPISGIGNMVKHMRRAHKEYRPFMCEHCPKSFLTKQELGQHNRSHSDHRPFLCSICHTKFKSKNSLRWHDISFHRDVFPFSCPYCDHKFKRQTSLVIHRRTHTGERPYPCPLCEKAFSNKIDMQRHTNTHSHIKRTKAKINK
jgi:KRAB domain-containing zinc finger protein